ncbi:MAG TPA: TlpA disulfide reductase family protein [Actinophytocola sp.]|uniref:TlpA disulfide reductase family protein n=1 Tax=Actinophytocola sp. TaxID=1872138 RepID=UPI002DB8F2F2|nr:TlpA disulfide reductase family protein [Actinophytocola sp.]HEU5471039.1 TlpA disulfide reductase family protein [Actinophytocola sp.]
MFVPIALAVLGALCLLNLLFILGVVRRLREHSTAIAALGRAGGMGDGVLAAGSEVGAFSATTIEGERVSADGLSGRTLVGFFAPGCEPCHLQLPSFVDIAADVPGGPSQVLAVVELGDGDRAAMVDRLRGVARVVLDEPGGAVTKAFAAEAFPSFCVLDERTITSSGHDITTVADPVAAV